MTNAEATLRLKHHFLIHNDGRPTPYLDEAARMAYYALEITDRLERADAEKHSYDWFIRDDDSEFDRGYSIGFQDGYNIALADIRGDAE